MGFFKKFKEVLLSVMPIVVIATILGIVYGAFLSVSLISFLLSSFLLVFGLTLFLFGVDMAFLPIGNQLGARITERKNVTLLLLSGFMLGVVVTVAEPDIRVLAGQISQINSDVNSSSFVFVIAMGVGLFMALSYIRALSGISIKLFIAVFILLTIGFSLFLPA